MKKVVKKKAKEKYVVVRAQSAGVFAGVLASKKGNEVTLNKCRRLWYWSGAASLSQLAIEGVKKPTECKFTVETDNHEILGVIEVIPATAKAKQSIVSVVAWQM